MNRGILITISILFSAFFIVSCSTDQIEGEGDITTETLQVTGFTGIHSMGVDPVVIQYGTEFLVEVTGHPNIISRIQTDVVNGIWQIELEPGNYGRYDLNYAITMPVLHSVASTGTGDIFIKEFIDQAALTVTLEGSGEFLGFPLQVEECSVEILGIGDAEVTVSSNLDVVIKGSGHVYYQGNPTIKEDITGSGKIIDSN